MGRFRGVVGVVVAGILCTLVPRGGAATGRRPQPRVKFVKMSVLRVGQLQKQYYVLLENQRRTRLLPIVIGLREAQAIQLGLSRITPPRPLTHNLLVSTIRALGKIQRVEITALRNKTFIGRLILKDSRGRQHVIDARPSDLIALAVATRKPIWVAAQVLRRSGIAHPKLNPRPRSGSGTPNA